MTKRNFLLVVDDDADFRDMLVLVLQAHGYRTLEASDGMDALEKVRSGELPSLVILDLRMPRMNGIELLAHLRAEPRLAEIPTIVMTGDLGGTREALAAGATACLRKPVEAGDLLASVRRYAA